MQYLGSIIVPAGGEASNLNTVGGPFYVPPEFPVVMVVTPPSSSVFNVVVGNNNTFVGADATEFALAGGSSNEFTVQPDNPYSVVVSLYSAGAGGTCAIYGLYGLAYLKE